MKLASLKRGGRDGTLVVVSRDLRWAVPVPQIAATMQATLDDWARLSPKLAAVANQIESGQCGDAEPFDPRAAAAPLPRAYQWLDASAYVHHVELVRKARNVAMPPSFWTDPIMYQGCSDPCLGPCDPLPAPPDGNWGADFEAEIAVIINDTPQGVDARTAARSICLITLVNDVSLRELISAELAKGFGFVHGKPPSAFSPVAVTPDELGSAWDGGKVSLPLRVELNGTLFGEPNAGHDMTFEFPQLISHGAKTRPLGAGTIVGAGTVSNRNPATGSCCIAERRTLEVLASGTAKTPYLRPDDRVRIEMLATDGTSIFGAIDQEVSSVSATSGAA